MLGWRWDVVKKAAAGTAAEKKALRPGQCREHMRKRLAAEFEGIVEGFVKQAKAGSCQHVKLATELLKGRVRKPKEPEGTATRMLREWRER